MEVVDLLSYSSSGPVPAVDSGGAGAQYSAAPQAWAVDSAVQQDWDDTLSWVDCDVCHKWRGFRLSQVPLSFRSGKGRFWECRLALGGAPARSCEEPCDGCLQAECACSREFQGWVVEGGTANVRELCLEDAEKLGFTHTVRYREGSNMPWVQWTGVCPCNGKAVNCDRTAKCSSRSHARAQVQAFLDRHASHRPDLAALDARSLSFRKDPLRLGAPPAPGSASAPTPDSPSSPSTPETPGLQASMRPPAAQAATGSHLGGSSSGASLQDAEPAAGGVQPGAACAAAPGPARSDPGGPSASAQTVAAEAAPASAPAVTREQAAAPAAVSAAAPRRSPPAGLLSSLPPRTTASAHPRPACRTAEGTAPLALAPALAQAPPRFAMGLCANWMEVAQAAAAAPAAPSSGSKRRRVDSGEPSCSSSSARRCVDAPAGAAQQPAPAAQAALQEHSACEHEAESQSGQDHALEAGAAATAQAAPLEVAAPAVVPHATSAGSTAQHQNGAHAAPSHLDTLASAHSAPAQHQPAASSALTPQPAPSARLGMTAAATAATQALAVPAPAASTGQAEPNAQGDTLAWLMRLGFPEDCAERLAFVAPQVGDLCGFPARELRELVGASLLTRDQRVALLLACR